MDAEAHPTSPDDRGGAGNDIDIERLTRDAAYAHAEGEFGRGLQDALPQREQHGRQVNAVLQLATVDQPQ